MNIPQIIQKSIETKQLILQDELLLKTIQTVADEIIRCYRKKGKVLLCGNGGSAADAQHLAAELSGRFYFDREPLAAEALHVNTSYLTAVANDYSYDEIYARYVKGAGRKGDILMGLSTSGNSANIVRAIETANAMGMTTIGLTGSKGGKMKGLVNHLINVPSDDTPRIQESHIMIGHIICEMVESSLFTRK